MCLRLFRIAMRLLVFFFCMLGACQGRSRAPGEPAIDTPSPPSSRPVRTTTQPAQIHAVTTNGVIELRVELKPVYAIDKPKPLRITLRNIGDEPVVLAINETPELDFLLSMRRDGRTMRSRVPPTSHQTWQTLQPGQQVTRDYDLDSFFRGFTEGADYSLTVRGGVRIRSENSTLETTAVTIRMTGATQ